jgi:hypothetical protein
MYFMLSPIRQSGTSRLAAHCAGKPLDVNVPTPSCDENDTLKGSKIPAVQEPSHYRCHSATKKQQNCATAAKLC